MASDNVINRLLKDLAKETGAKCSLVARGQNFPHLLQKLIVRGLTKNNETDITVFCRTKDTVIVKKALNDVIKEYIAIVQKTSSVVPKICFENEQ